MFQSLLTSVTYRFCVRRRCEKMIAFTRNLQRTISNLKTELMISSSRLFATNLAPYRTVHLVVFSPIEELIANLGASTCKTNLQNQATGVYFSAQNKLLNATKNRLLNS